MERFEGAPKEQDPRYIQPAAKSCIVLAFRIPRGYLRGIEEEYLDAEIPPLDATIPEEEAVPLKKTSKKTPAKKATAKDAPAKKTSSKSAKSSATKKTTKKTK